MSSCSRRRSSSGSRATPDARTPCTSRGCSTPTARSSAARIRCPAAPPRCCPRSCPHACCRGPLRDRADPWRADGDEQPVGWAIAAAVAARTATLRRLGPFDPEQFLFFEDLDLCLRARAAGVPTILHPDLALEHRGGHSTEPAYGGEPHELLAARRRAVVRANLGRRALALDDAAQALTFATRAAARIALAPRRRA